MSASSWLRAVGDLVLPRTCAGCACAATWWCVTCASVLDGEPRRHEPEVDPGEPALSVHAVAPYRGPAGRALVAAKERGVVALVPPLGAALARSVLAAVTGGRSSTVPAAGPVVLVPAPSRPAAVRARGADVVAELARVGAERLRSQHGVDARVVRCLVHARPVADQTTLDVDQRATNLAGALRVRPVAAPLLAGRAVVVVDDVLTTGATLREAARAVRAAADRVAPTRMSAATVAVAGTFGAANVDESAQTVVPSVRDG